MQVLLVLVGLILGSLIGRLAHGVRYLEWLSFGDRFGLKPTTLDLGVMQLTVGFEMEITIAAILGLILAIFVCRKLR